MKRVFAAILVTVLSSAPGWSQKKIEQIVARVNADIILKSDLDRETEIRRLQLKDEGLEGARLEQRLAEESKTILGDLIDRSLLVQVAKEHGESAELEVMKTMEELRTSRGFATADALEKAIAEQYGDVEEFKNDIRTKYLTQRVLRNDVYWRIVVTNEEMRTYYDAHKQEFDKPAGVRVSVIVVLFDPRLPDQMATQRKKIEEAFAALKKGDKFEEVAQKYSEESSAADGGDLGFTPREELDAERLKIFDPLAKGQTTEILTETGAYVIFKLTDKHSGGILPFELAQQYIGDVLMGNLAGPRVREYLVKLRKEGFVEVHEGYVDTGATTTRKSDSSSVIP